jgi:Leucine-rich repeat (LRR) protein
MKKNLLTFILTVITAITFVSAKADNVITMTTSLLQNSSIKLYVKGNGTITIDGVKESVKAEMYADYTTTKQIITITGNVESLNCGNIQLTSLDVSKNTVLAELTCCGNNLNSLNVSNNTALRMLNCNNNKLTQLDVSKNTNLENLMCNNNKLTALDVSKNTKLSQLDFWDNNIRGEKIDELITSLVNRNNYLYGNGFFECIDLTNKSEGNIITTTQVKDATAKGWNVYDSNRNAYAGSIAASNSISMTTSLPTNSPIILNIVANGNVTIDGATGTYQSGTAVTYTTTKQDITITGDITDLNCSGISLTSLNFSKDSLLQNLDCHKNSLTSLNLNYNKDLKKLDCYENQLKGAQMSELIESLVDRSEMETKGYLTAISLTNTSEGNIITTSQVKSATALGWNVNDSDNKDYAGSKPTGKYITITTLRPAGSLIKLFIKANGNVGIDGAKGTFFPNNMTSLTTKQQTITINGDITLFSCENDSISSLDVSNDALLDTLICDVNSLTSLDVSKNKNLKLLNCSDNELYSLDVSNNNELKKLVCYLNNIYSSNMDNLIESLFDRSENETKGELCCIYKKDPLLIENNSKGNVIDTIQVAAAKARGWNVSDNYWNAYAGSEPENYITMTTSLPVNSTINLFYYTDGKNTIDGATKNVSGTDSYTLTKQTVTIKAKVTYLECYGNNLTSLDLSHSTALEELNCNSNNLTTLDLSHNTKLKVITCYGNKFKDSVMDALIASLPDRTSLTPGIFAVVSNDETDANRNICTTIQVAAAKAKNWIALKLDSEGSLTEYAGSKPNQNVITMTTSLAKNSPITFYIDATSSVTIDGATGTFVNAQFVTYNTTKDTITITGDVTKIWCIKDSLTALDVTNDTVLELLGCYYNKLQVLDVTKNKVLKVLGCWCNQLKTLDVTKNKELKVLDCTLNKLQTLDVSNNTELTDLNCGGTQLQALDVSKNTKLETLACCINNIKGANMDALINSLTDRSSKPAGTFYVREKIDDDEDENICTIAQVAAAKAKNWNTKCYIMINGKCTKIDFYGYYDITKVYSIGSKADWDTFVKFAMAYPTMKAKLTADIDDVNTMVGLEGSPYRGTFDGDNHKMTINYDTNEETTAPFRYVYNGCTIENLNVSGTIKTSKKYAAGLIGQSIGTSKGMVTVKKCNNNVDIESSIDGDGTHGGYVGRMQGKMDITNCVFSGSINGSNTTSCGGFCGWCDNDTLNITNCLNIGTFNINTEGNGNSATFSRFRLINETLLVMTDNALYLNALGDIQGESVAKELLASGFIAHKMQNKQSDNALTWGQDLSQEGNMPLVTNDINLNVCEIKFYEYGVDGSTGNMLKIKYVNHGKTLKALPTAQELGFEGDVSLSFTADNKPFTASTVINSDMTIYVVINTGINTITDDALNSKAIYDLSGRKLDKVPDKGIYIQGGKKFIVR